MTDAATPRRIILLGCAGAGKSRLARRLASAMSAQEIILDDLWRPDWGPSHTPAFRDLLAELHRGEAWVSDGNFAAVTFDVRLPRAQRILWLERPRWLCMLRATTRALAGGEGHSLRDLPKVIRFMWSFDRVNRPRIEAALAVHGKDVPVLRLRTDGEIDRAVADLSV